MARESESGLPIEPLYGPRLLEGWDPAEKLGEPGAHPFTRGVYPSMYTGPPVDDAPVRGLLRPWSRKRATSS